ncbi:MAG: hypothetical protein AB8B87_19300 [Granulosicoccus sp.]
MSSENIPIRTMPSAEIVLRTVTMLYSLACYVIGVLALVYLILFIADLWVPVTINRGSGVAPEGGALTDVFWNVCLVIFWGMQHSIMARPAFKRVWTKVVPVPAERSTYLLCVALVTALMLHFWVPMPAVIWDLSGTVLSSMLIGVYFLGWFIVLFSTFLINHFHLFGLQQTFFTCVAISPSRRFSKPLFCINWFVTL